MATADEVLVRPPQHPVPTLQGPFEESMLESISEVGDRDVPEDAITRRALLLEAPRYERIISGRWRQRHGEKYHPLWKLIAQMAFGIHLLAQSLAKSDEEVMKILQGHVDDVDGFLERTTDDFEVAQEDIYERLRCLQLPLEHSGVFDRMLEDRAFRASILDGNEKIEHIVSRTTKAMRDSMKDVQKGFDATNVLDGYLNNLGTYWDRQTAEHEAVFLAMLGNIEGWRKALMDMHLQGNKLAGTLNKLSRTVAEMQHRAVMVSRRQLTQSQGLGVSPSQVSLAAYSERSASRTSQNHKPLPVAPGDQKPGSRGPSRATQTFSSSSRPDSAQQSSRANSPESRSILNASPDSFVSKRNLGSPIPPSDLDSRTMSPQPTLQNQSTLPTQQQSQHRQQTINSPIELPAHVPEEVLRQAPVSKNNRMSMTLGPKAQDVSEQRKPTTYYPRVISSLLKTQSSPTILSSLPNGNRVLTMQSASPQAEPPKDYFADHEQNLSIGVATIAGPKKEESTKSSRAGSVKVASPSSSKLQDARNTPSPLLAFTSHTDVMEMASPPSISQQNAVDVVNEGSESHGRMESRSSLGEPGPEIADAELEDEPQSSPASLSIGPGDLLGSTDIRLGRPPQRSVLQATIETSSTSQASMEGTSSPPDRQSREWKEVVPDSVKPIENSKLADTYQLRYIQPDRDSNDEKPNPAVKPRRGTDIAVELEANNPVGEAESTPESPIELDAIEKQLTLSSDLPTLATSAEGSVATTTSVKQRAEYFQNIPTYNHEPALKPKDFDTKVGVEREPIKPLRLRVASLDGYMVPILATPTPADEKAEAHTGPLTPVDRTISTADVLANMIDQISSTPTSSPPHERSSSRTSSNSAQIVTSTASRGYAPPESAPAPPGPGGRSMVNPDYASAAIFDGERKAPKHSSTGSRSGWDILGGGPRPRASTDLRGISLRPGSRRRTSAELLTSAGKDILWYKDTKNAVPVSLG